VIGLRLDGEENFFGESIDTPAKNYLKKSEQKFLIKEVSSKFFGHLR